MFRRLAKALRQPAQPRPRKAGATVESLEKRELLAISPVFAGTKIKGINLSSGGVSTNQTLITVPFTGNVTLSDITKIRLFGYAQNPASANLAQIKKTVHVVNANVFEFDENGDGVMDKKY